MAVPWSIYVDHLIGQRLGQKTIHRYLRWVRDADRWLTARGSNLDEASASEIFAFAEERVVNSHSSRGQAAAALRHYWDMTDRDRPPIRAIRVPPAPEMVCRAITEEQARDVVKMAAGWWMPGSVVLVGMYLALRRFEIAKMEWTRFSDDLSEYTVTGKYDKTRTLPVHPMLASELGGHRLDSPWVFPGLRRSAHQRRHRVGVRRACGPGGGDPPPRASRVASHVPGDRQRPHREPPGGAGLRSSRQPGGHGGLHKDDEEAPPRRLRLPRLPRMSRF